MPIGRSRRRGMVVGAAVASSRANKRAAESQVAAQPAAPAVAPPSDADAQIVEIQKFFELKNQGVITEDEFNAKKRQILGL